MRIPYRQHVISRRRGGFAIIVVLSSLLVLTALFAIASQRSLSHIYGQASERDLVVRRTANAEILTLLIGLPPPVLSDGNITLPEPYADISLRIQDVGGLVDLNTASPELLDRMYGQLGISPSAAAEFRSWRRDGRRLLRVSDLIRITGRQGTDLDTIATVYSGRRGIAADLAPPEVVHLFGNAVGDIPAAFQSAPSGANYSIYDEQGNHLGVISVSAQDGQSRVLEVR